MQKKVVNKNYLAILLAFTCFASFVQAGEEQTAFGPTLGQLTYLADQGDPRAQFELATLYHSGSGVNYDESEAVKLYHLAAENGSLMAQEYLATAYSEGWFGLPSDNDHTSYWRDQLNQSIQNAYKQLTY